MNHSDSSSKVECAAQRATTEQHSQHGAAPRNDVENFVSEEAHGSVTNIQHEDQTRVQRNWGQQLRSILFLLFLIVFTPPYAIMCLVAAPWLKRQGRYRLACGWNQTVVYVVRWLCGIRYRVIGWDNYHAIADQQAIVLSKHQSTWETIALPVLLGKRLCFVFKRELLFIPFFGWAMAQLKMIHINRKQGNSAFLSISKQGKKYLALGDWIIFFPEGTRTRSGTTQRYKTGGARLAIATQSWVLPIAHNAGRFWPRNQLTKFPGEIVVSIGPPISSLNKTVEQLSDEVSGWIEQEMRIIDADSYSRPLSQNSSN